MFAKLPGATLVGLDCAPVTIEVDLHKGQTNFTIVGLADVSIKEAKDRIHSALKNSGFSYPFNFRILINLAPADLPKEGSGYDLPMAVGIVLVSTNVTPDLSDALIVGELALDGAVRHVNGLLPLAIYAKTHGLKRLFVPAADAAEAALVAGVTVFPVHSLKQLIDHLQGESLISPFTTDTASVNENCFPAELDISFIKGQEFAKRALEIAASGSHNMLLSGPPGSGKTLLARTLPSILPPLTPEETLEVSKIYSVAGLLPHGIIRERPFRTAHHTASGVALVGGGRIPRPGEISLAHRGVLFLDELPEFPRFVIEQLRQPLEDGTITISRAHGSVHFPARFILIASQNPCPCGFASDPARPCTCSAQQISRYQKKLSGPLLDRIDLHLEVPRVAFDKLTDTTTTESSDSVRKRVIAARERQQKRFLNSRIHTNSEMGPAEIKQFCVLDTASQALLRDAAEHLHLSARGYHRLLKMSRTIADLGNCDTIQLEHVAEALQFRTRQPSA